MIRSEIKVGTVNKIGKNKLWVGIDSGCETATSHCAQGECAGCSSTSSGTNETIIPVTDTEKYPIGQKIEFQLYYLNENLVAFIVFGIPIVAALLTLMTWYILSPQDVEKPKSLISAALALAGGFFIVHTIDAWFRSRFPTKIISTLSSETKKQL
jgi:hypothetical protein